MSEQTNWPKRGEMSADGELYTHLDGTVHRKVDPMLCEHCSIQNRECSLARECAYELIEGVYVLSDAEQKACDMAREALRTCNFHASIGCANCGDFVEKSCPSRRYLAEMKQPKAWEVTP